MPQPQEHIEQAPIDPERLRAVAEWLRVNVRPAAQVIGENAAADDQTEAMAFDARDYQLEAWVRLDDRRAEGGTRALGNLATGLGKTFVAAIDVMRYQEWCGAQSPPIIPRVLYVSHQSDINLQAEKTFRSVMPDADYATFNPRHKQLPEADVTFATIQSLYKNLHRFDPQDFEYIIWDESHHLEAETYKAVRDYFDPLFEHAITATVERMDGKDIQEYFGEPLYKKSLPEGIAEGWLKDVDYHIVFDASIKEKLQGGFNPKTLQEIKDLFQDKPPADAIARNIEEEIERLGLTDPKTIVFCANIHEANEMAALLGGVAYHSETEDREQKLDDFRAGRNRIMTTRDMFNEGVDIPDAEVIVFLRSTQSNTIFEQQLGRGLRKSAGRPKVYVLDFVANIERIAKIRELSESIQRRARELGEREAVEEGIILERPEAELEPEPSLHIHTTHSDFDFDKIAVDLLAKWRLVQYEKNLQIPDGWLSSVGMHNKYGINPYAVERLAANLKIVGVTMRSGSGTGIFYSPKDQSAILEVFRNERDTETDWLNIKSIADKNSTSEKVIKRIIEELGLEGRLTRNSRRHRVVRYSPSQQDLITIELAKRQPPPKDWLTAVLIQKTYGINPKVTNRVAASLGLQGTRKMNKGKEATFYSPEEVRMILENAPESQELLMAPEGYLKITEVEELTGLSNSTVLKHLAKLGIEWTLYAGKSKRPVRYISPAQVDSLVRDLSTETLPVVPEGFLSAGGAARELGISQALVKNLCSALDLAPHQYLNERTKRVCNYLSIEQIAVIKNSEYLQVAEATGEYNNASGISKILGMSRESVKNIAEALQLEPTRLKEPKTKKILDYYSDQQIDQIRSYRTKS